MVSGRNRVIHIANKGTKLTLAWFKCLVKIVSGPHDLLSSNLYISMNTNINQFALFMNDSLDESTHFGPGLLGYLFFSNYRLS